VILYANVAGVKVNLRGRQAQGAVAPGVEYEAVRDQVIAAAADWRDPDTGQPLVCRAYRREDLYTGDRVTDLPDIILELTSGYSVVATMPPRTVTLATATFRTGEHKAAGIFLAYGPAIQPGPVRGAQIGDLAPTILHLAGLPVPADMDGRVLTETFDTCWLATHPVRSMIAATHSALAVDDVYTAEETAAINARLAGLGYL
jgi:predicted AlkP superfamily phosphohydrolase/phosphomutase